MPVATEAVSSLVQVIQSLSRSMRSIAGASTDGFSLSTLIVLGRVEDLGEVRASGLADLLGVDISVVSRQLAVLEAAGLTGRRRDPQDGRAWLAHITAEGSRQLQEVRSAKTARIGVALDDWTDEEAWLLHGQLSRLAEALQQAGQEHDPPLSTAMARRCATRTGQHADPPPHSATPAVAPAATPGDSSGGPADGTVGGISSSTVGSTQHEKGPR